MGVNNVKNNSKKSHTPIPTINDFPDQPIQFKGTIVAITKINNHEGMMVKISLSDGTYIETNCGNDSVLFGLMCKLFDLDRPAKITIENK